MHRNHKLEGFGIGGILLAAVLGILLATMLPDLKRYLRIQRM